MASPKMNLKLLIDRKGSGVLFAEAPKEFVDFLFHMLSFPLGTLSSNFRDLTRWLDAYKENSKIA
ncbi:hypothetical protein Hanom_Chr08g00705361 [Helianthus anomalus]